MPTRRTSRRTSRRAARALRSNARPIRVDPQLLNELMVHVARALRKFKRRLEAYGTKAIEGFLTDMEYGSLTSLMKPILFKMKNVHGATIRVRLELLYFDPLMDAEGRFSRVNDELRNWHKELARLDTETAELDQLASMKEAEAKTKTPDTQYAGPPNLGTYDEYLDRTSLSWGKKHLQLSKKVALSRIRALEYQKQRGIHGTITLYATPDPLTGRRWTWANIDSPQKLERIKYVLEHEMIHASDIYGKKKLGIMPERPSSGGGFFWEQTTEYANLVPEVRAYMMNMLREAEPRIREKLANIASVRRVTPRDQASVVLDAIEQTDYWQSLGKHFSQKSRNLIFKGIVTALEDEGIITIE